MIFHVSQIRSKSRDCIQWYGQTWMATWPLGDRLCLKLGPLGQGFNSSWWLISFDCRMACLGKSTKFVIHVRYHESAMP